MDSTRSRTLSCLALTSARGGGDWPPVVALSRGMRQRGHRVTMLCDDKTQEAISGTGLPCICVPDELEQSRYFARWARQLDQGSLPSAMTAYPLTEWARDTLPAIRDAVRARQPDLIVSSLFSLPLAELLGAELGLPWCFVNPSFYFGAGSQRSWESDFAEPSRSTFRNHFLPLAERAELVLHATDPGIDFPPRHLPSHHHYVGPLFWEAPAPVPAFLDESGPPWVLVSLSTVPQAGDLAIARGVMHALQGAPFRVLVTMTAEHDLAELGDLPDNVHVGSSISHAAVLPLSQLVVSHAGHGIVMKALAHGVPLVLAPWGRDQPGVAARAAVAGAANVVARDEFTRERLAEAIWEVIENPRFAMAANSIATRMRAHDAVAAASQLLETLPDLDAGLSRTGQTERP